jgi:hypothetical protein
MHKLIRSPKLLLTLLLALAASAALAAGALAEAGSSVNDETIQTAVPLQPGTPVSGIFQDGRYTNSPDGDHDYLRFTVAHAGQVLGFTVQNTTSNSACNKIDKIDQDSCPVYATLMDSTGQHQVGGSTSSAGTVATAADTESFSWKFATPGTYYVLMENDGNLANGYPAYKLTLSSTPTRVIDVSLAHVHRSSRAAIGYKLTGPANVLHMSVRTRSASPRLVMRRTLYNLSAGHHRIRFLLPRWVRRRLAHGHSIPVLIRAAASSSLGTRVTKVKRTLRP